MNWFELLLLRIFIKLGTRWFNLVEIDKENDIVTSIRFGREQAE